MKTRRRLTSGDLMLLELIFAILFFCLAMAASLSVFGNAYEMSEKAEATDLAVFESNGAAELIRSSSTLKEAETLLKNNGYSVKDGTSSEKLYGDGRFKIAVNMTEKGKLVNAEFNCFYMDDKGFNDPSEPFYTITIKHYMKGDGNG